MDVILRTNFHDYYDHWFDVKGTLWDRFSNGGMSRREMLQFLSSHGEVTPTFGIASSLQLPDEEKVVVYTDEFAHRSEGKVLISMIDAKNRYRSFFATAYVTADESASSIRRLQVGEMCFWLRYRSDDAWRSNAGNVSIGILSYGRSIHETITEPLFAIDYVEHENKLYAVDYNIAPQIKGTGVEEILSAKEVASLIKESIEKSTRR